MPRGNSANSQTMKATLGLRELLLNGVFKPRERVPELRLVEELGVSRTPLRIALMKLEHEGLLETLPGGGFVLREFTRNDIDDAIELRGVLEGTAARLAAERLESPDELVELRETVMQLDDAINDESPDGILAFSELNEAFHNQFVALAKSEQVTRAVDLQKALPFATPAALLPSLGQLPEWHELLVVAQYHHRSLLEAIEARQGTRADEIAREHARLSRHNLELYLERHDLLDNLPGAPLLSVELQAGARTAD